jgi:hypothetical protein
VRRCTEACFAHEHSQGHGCLCDTNTTRSMFGMKPLRGDEPELDLPAWLKYLCVVAACVCMAIAAGACDPLFPR